MRNPRVRLSSICEWSITNPQIESEDVEIEENPLDIVGVARPVKVAMFVYCDAVLAASNNAVVMPLGAIPAGAKVGDEFHLFVERMEPDFPEGEFYIPRRRKGRKRSD